MSYTKTNWRDGDVITASKMNKIEDGIENSLSEKLQALYKTMVGNDWPYENNPTDAEVIDKIAKDAAGGGSGGASSGRVIELFASITAGQDGVEIGGQTDAGLTIKDLASSLYLISMEGGSNSVVSMLAAIENNTSNIHKMYIKLGNVTQTIYYIVDTGEITNANPNPQPSTS